VSPVPQKIKFNYGCPKKLEVGNPSFLAVCARGRGFSL
jgi:hypothetical protein